MQKDFSSLHLYEVNVVKEAHVIRLSELWIKAHATVTLIIETGFTAPPY